MSEIYHEWTIRIYVVPLFTELKYVSKCVRLIATFLNIFATLHLMHVISIHMDSKHYVDNLQPVFGAKTSKFHMKKEGGKLDDFWKTIFDWHNWYSANP